MSVVLVFLAVVIGFSLWWLAHQRVFSRPWLEVGPDPAGGPDEFGMPTEKIALGVFLAVVGALFALFASAYVMRTEFVDWRPMPLPRVVWVNTGLLVLASVLLQCALTGLRRGDAATLRLGLGAGAVATLGFVFGQLAAWRELTQSGFPLTDSPASSFFYLLTGLHGLHILGGLVALAGCLPLALGERSLNAGRPDITRVQPGPNITRVQPGNITRVQPDNFTRVQVRRRLRLELCATYWHFLLLVWLGLLVLFTGWAAQAVALCRALLT